VFYSEQADELGRVYYETLDLAQALDPRTIVAFEMDGAPLAPEHGAPLRLRCETQLGFKMVKWLRRIELVERCDAAGEGQGGYREATMFYEREAPI
jgi:DMSO/TMAO reductase YedYZ molybdopterin-dependent catalytic subunit